MAGYGAGLVVGLGVGLLGLGALSVTRPELGREPVAPEVEAAPEAAVPGPEPEVPPGAEVSSSRQPAGD